MRRLAVTCLAMASLLLTACGARSGEDGGTNPDVPVTASPEEVVGAYVAALQQRDESGAVALTIHAYGWGDAWSGDPPRISDVEVGEASPSELIGPTQNQWTDAVVVPVSMDVQGGEVIPDGPADLEFTLWRGRVNDRWLIAGLYTDAASGSVYIS